MGVGAMKYEYVVGVEYSREDIEAFLNKQGKLGFRLVKAYIDPASSDTMDGTAASVLIMERQRARGYMLEAKVKGGT